MMLETERLYFRHWKMDDKEQLFEIWKAKYNSRSKQ